MARRPTFALIDETRQALDIAEGFLNTIAQRRTGADQHAAYSAVENVRRASRQLDRIEREDEE